MRSTNEGAYGYALDTETSPSSLVAAQAHLGHLAESGDPRRWDEAGELTPIQRYADMFSGTGLMGLDGTAWYHPLRLTIDAGAVAAGNANPAQDILDVDATHGADLGKAMRILVFGAALGNQRVMDAANALAQQSGIKAGKMVRINRADDLLPQRPELGLPRQRVRGQARPVPGHREALNRGRHGALLRGVAWTSRATGQLDADRGPRHRARSRAAGKADFARSNSEIRCQPRLAAHPERPGPCSSARRSPPLADEPPRRQGGARREAYRGRRRAWR